MWNMIYCGEKQKFTDTTIILTVHAVLISFYAFAEKVTFRIWSSIKDWQAIFSCVTMLALLVDFCSIWSAWYHDMTFHDGTQTNILTEKTKMNKTSRQTRHYIHLVLVRRLFGWN